MKLSKYYYKYLGVKKLPRKRKKAFKKERMELFKFLIKPTVKERKAFFIKGFQSIENNDKIEIIPIDPLPSDNVQKMIEFQIGIMENIANMSRMQL